jgi:cysteine-rich repeat protein
MRIATRVMVVGGLIAALSVGGWAPAHGAVSKECKASRKCRGAIVSRSSKATAQALKSLDKCHAKRDAGKFAGDCNAIDGAALIAKGAGLINKRCAPTDPVRCLFRDCDPVGSIGQSLGTALRATAADIQGSPSLGGDKQHIKCHKAVGSARSTLVKTLLKSAIGCQKLGDAGSCEFTPTQCSNVVAPASTTAGLRGKISRACGSLTGDDIDSCSPLPDCVIDSAVETAQRLVKQIYSSAAECGDGIITPPNEECDDGNDIDDDACSNSCRPAVCGDNITQSNEECDDNANDEDACAQCKLARCGDGFIRTEVGPNETAEQCDDGNDVADDGCTNCTIDAISCDPAVGYRVTVAIDYDRNAADMNSIRVSLGYPVGVSIPGTGQDPSVQQRITILGPNPADFLSIGNDQDVQPPAGVDDTLTVLYASLADTLEDPDDGIAPGDQMEVHYDCADGARFSGDDFTCNVLDASDLSSTPILDAQCIVRVSAP